jgi:hypothetical protein
LSCSLAAVEAIGAIGHSVIWIIVVILIPFVLFGHGGRI